MVYTEKYKELITAEEIRNRGTPLTLLEDQNWGRSFPKFHSQVSTKDVWEARLPDIWSDLPPDISTLCTVIIYFYHYLTFRTDASLPPFILLYGFVQIQDKNCFVFI